MTTMSTLTDTTASTDAAAKRIFNFSAGPATLPPPVIRQAQTDLWSIFDSGIGIMEHSHRGKVFDRVYDEAVEDCRRVAGIPDSHDVLFLQGGASLQFTMVPMNFLGEGATADYLDTGVWTTKAIKEARRLGAVNVAFDGRADDFAHVPDEGEMTRTPGAAYLHYCTNNTIYGTRFNTAPAPDAPLVSDMSSDIFSRPVDVGRHALIYAGAQKNLGPAGVTLVLIDKAFMASGRADLPTMLDYRQHASKGSRMNTPPTFGIYVMGQVFKWILELGGLDEMARRNREKAAMIYTVIDELNGFYRAVARPDCRSDINLCFTTPSPELDATFVTEAAGHDMSDLKGHRNVGGLRASIYNAFPPQGCEVLAEFMRDFARRNG
jgi:phosphoserine aminotransferase